MYLDALRIRLSLMAMGLVALLTFVALGGRIGPGSRSTVIIDYSIEPRLFEGAEVVIDGESAGLLHLLGSHPRTGFEVKKGVHEVRLAVRGFACRPRRIDVARGNSVVLRAEVPETLIGDNLESQTPVIELR